MTIPKEIKDIIDNAVKNGELTKQKRNLVVQMAMSMGVDKNDVYQYIDEAERIKAHTIVIERAPEDEPVIDLTEPTPPPYQPTQKESDGFSIPQKIQDLIALALQDRVLTYKERQIIVSEAVNTGMDESTINRYIDDELAKRLQSYTKEELKHCPACGAQIPLISDECFYCGSALETDSTRKVIKVTGNAANVIQQENQQTAEAQRNIQQCPDCGAPFPLVSHICTHCGHVLHENRGTDYNIRSLIDNIVSCINSLRKAQKPNFVNIFLYNIEIVIIIVGLILLLDYKETLCLARGTGALCGLFLVPIGMFIPLFTNRDWTVKRANKGENPWKISPVEAADIAFYNALVQYEKFASQINTIYGKNAEAQNELARLNNEINTIKKERKNNLISIAIVYAVIIALLITIKCL